MLKSKNTFFLHGNEVREVMRRGEIGTVTAAVRLLVPDCAFFRVAKSGYSGVRTRRRPASASK